MSTPRSRIRSSDITDKFVEKVQATVYKHSGVHVGFLYTKATLHAASAIFSDREIAALRKELNK